MQGVRRRRRLTQFDFAGSRSTPVSSAIMRENTPKQQLYTGKAALGVMCAFLSPPVVEMLGHLARRRCRGRTNFTLHTA